MDSFTITTNIDGSFTCSTIHKGYRVHKQYIGYTLTETKQAFRDYLKTL